MRAASSLAFADDSSLLKHWESVGGYCWMKWGVWRGLRGAFCGSWGDTYLLRGDTPALRGVPPRSWGVSRALPEASEGLRGAPPAPRGSPGESWGVSQHFWGVAKNLWGVPGEVGRSAPGFLGRAPGSWGSVAEVWGRCPRAEGIFWTGAGCSAGIFRRLWNVFAITTRAWRCAP